ncbi:MULTISPECIES: SsgA family sporulation/cell division regulator [unclassified Streptomyces]|uniref:SsgA family sporulation/cell division regulator n=1 Tax=unclassified Streptomyces TaxID=2593676 RepID=UPI0033286D19
MHSTDPDRTRRLHTDLDIGLVLSDAEALRLEVRFSYESADPFAVRMDFRDGPDTVAPWLFSRDLLDAGLRVPSGEGSVRVWPPCRCHGSTTLRILLRGPGGAAVLYIPADPFEGWLAQTFEAVPAGSESSHLVWDDILAKLLRGD